MTVALLRPDDMACSEAQNLKTRPAPGPPSLSVPPSRTTAACRLQAWKRRLLAMTKGDWKSSRNCARSSSGSSSPRRAMESEGSIFRSTVASTRSPRSRLVIVARRKHYNSGAGEGNRTLVFSLGSCCSTIELHPRWPAFRMSGGPASTIRVMPHSPSRATICGRSIEVRMPAGASQT